MCKCTNEFNCVEIVLPSRMLSHFTARHAGHTVHILQQPPGSSFLLLGKALAFDVREEVRLFTQLRSI